MKISVIGIGYVGLSLAVLISTKHEVVAIDVIPEKIRLINERISPIKDKEIEEYFSNKEFMLSATTDLERCKGSDFIIISTPTDYDLETKKIDTTIVESVLNEVREICPESTFVIKSTVPIGYTRYLYRELGIKNILVSPEFLREGHALYDNLHPSRIVVGTPCNDLQLKKKAIEFSKILEECSLKNNISIIITGSTEAESIKLFSNSYLAMRVAFFNELDSFAEQNELDSKDLITGISMDNRIGNYYNNPSFGYGGYCLPKDTKQLLSNYHDVPNDIIAAIVNSNDARKKFVAERIDSILKMTKGNRIGIYRLTMKSESDNFRESSIVDIINKLDMMNYEIIIYEPTLSDEKMFDKWNVIKKLDEFKLQSDIVVANRYSNELSDIKYKVYTRDIFFRD